MTASNSRISPGTKSDLPILWKPSISNICPTVPLPISHHPITMPKDNTNFQRLANRLMAHSRIPPDPIYEQEELLSELESTTLTLSPLSKTFAPSKQCFVSETKCDETIPEHLAPAIATVTVESITHAQEKNPPPQIEVFTPTSQPVPPKPPSNNSIRYILSLETNFFSMHSAPYPPCPSTHVTALSIRTATPPIEPILTQV